MSTLIVELQEETLTRLQTLANEAQIPVGQMVETLINDFVANEPTKADILHAIRRGMIQALKGEGRPAREVLDEIDRDAEAEYDHAD